MNLSLLRPSLLTIYKSFVRPHLDYGDLIYDQPNNSNLPQLYQELGLESLMNRRWFRRMSYLYKTILTKSPPYLYELIPPRQRSHRYPGCFKTSHCRTELFRNSFLSFTVNE